MTFQKPKIYDTKKPALKDKKDYQILGSLGNVKSNFKFFLLDNYQDLLAYLYSHLLPGKEINPNGFVAADFTSLPLLYEYTFEKLPINFFYDIEIKLKDNPAEFKIFRTTVEDIINVTEVYLREVLQLQVRTLVLISHTKQKVDDSLKKKSFHVIFRCTDSNGSPVYFKNVHVLKILVKYLFPALTDKKIVDLSVFREGCFRTIYSTKTGEQRPLIKSKKIGLKEPYDDIETFVQFTPNVERAIIIGTSDLHLSAAKVHGSGTPVPVPTACSSNVPTTKQNSPPKRRISIKDAGEIMEVIITPAVLAELTGGLTDEEKEIIKEFVVTDFKIDCSLIKEIKIESDRIIVGTVLKLCRNVNREHKSNNQYVLIDKVSSVQRCHDEDCKKFMGRKVFLDEYPTPLQEIVKKYFEINVVMANEVKRKTLITDSEKESTEYVKANYDPGVEDMKYDKERKIFCAPASEKCALTIQGNCIKCKIEHRIDGSEYCAGCLICEIRFPAVDKLAIPARFVQLNNFTNNYYGPITNITNIYGSTVVEEDFSCDIQLDPACGVPSEFITFYNQILDGHRVVKISELLRKMQVDFVYANELWYAFDGSIWKSDKECLKLRQSVVDLSSNFSKIKLFYEKKTASDAGTAIIKNIKSLITKLHKTGFEDDIIKGAKMYFDDELFRELLNSKKHLVPFNNGVYDLLTNEFRSTKKEDYVNLTVRFDYDPDVKNPEVYDFVQKILPDTAVRDYVLKKMAECLNGDIPNTNFMMFIGDGANGKSQILNLMKLTMGQLAEKVEVTLLTRKRNNANEANPEKIKLMYKRFAYLSEPEDGEKLNIGLLKELTGSEEIVSRALYVGSTTFVMETKLFLACNELPEIKGEDNAIWRRIRVVNFPSRFVDEPKESNEFKIDRTLPSRMREDVTWRQTFVNILLDYYKRDVKEPESVKMSTNTYRSENNDIKQFLTENVIRAETSILHLKNICEAIHGKKNVHSSVSNKIRKEVELFLKETFSEKTFEMKVSTFQGEKYRGWVGYSLS
jgi:P4 family phage/plasmid primase-like protien